MYIFGRKYGGNQKLSKRRKTTIKLKLLNLRSPINIKHSNCAMYTDPLNVIRFFHANGKTI